MSIWESIVAGLAVVGSVLGILNTAWVLFFRERVRLKVDAAWCINLTELYRWRVCVTNLSAFPVQITEVTLQSKVHKGFFYDDELGRKLPQIVEPRTHEVFFTTPLPKGNFSYPRDCKFRIKTACGVTRYTKAIGELEVD